MYGTEIVPGWFYIMVLIVFILFVGIGYWVTRNEKGLQTGGDGKLAEKAVYYENRFRSSAHPAEIIDVKTNYVGYVKRNFDSMIQQLISFVSPRRHIKITAESHNGNLQIHLQHIKNETKFLYSGWEAEMISNGQSERITIESQSKKKSTIKLSFSYRGEVITVSDHRKVNEMKIKKNGYDIASITYQKKLPPRKIFIDSKESKLPLLLLACMFEVIKYYD
ncbi:hypothetical protein HP456_00810 [Bacillus haikouensis]|uniref:tubby C-terminal domain-like protein n=1 Tax=Bacillus haikouensis TaxID=1510468 RepID=UPI0015524C3D|nr:hypothetical protein [Bacillus haikouensis]NQD64462.1 hypothetical protein [Bacillus haikouensis]